MLIMLPLLMMTALGGVAVAQTYATPVVPTDNGGAVRELLYARPFEVNDPFTYWWTAERPEIGAGYILVVAVDPEFAKPRQVDMPVLYVGHTPAQLTHVGYESGHLVVIVPATVNLATDPIFFGSLELPERVDAARGAQEMAAALTLGIRPVAEDKLSAALAAGGETLREVDLEGVMLTVADLIDEYAPDESEVAESYRLPRLQR